MTTTDQIKILNKKNLKKWSTIWFRQKTAIISALSSKNYDEAEYLTVEDLGLKPSTVEQTRFEYSPLGKIFYKGLDKDYKKKAFLKG